MKIYILYYCDYFLQSRFNVLCFDVSMFSVLMSVFLDNHKLFHMHEDSSRLYFHFGTAESIPPEI